MTVVVEDLDLPNSQTPYAQVDITLAGNDCMPVFGYHSTSHAIIGTLQLKPGDGIDADGVWQADLIPNSLITPAGTSYRIVRRASDGSKWVSCVEVPIVTGGEPIPVSSLPQNTPEGIDPAALALHADDPDAHGVFVEVSGDTMTGSLVLSGSSSDLTVGGDVVIGGPGGVTAAYQAGATDSVILDGQLLTAHDARYTFAPDMLSNGTSVPETAQDVGLPRWSLADGAIQRVKWVWEIPAEWDQVAVRFGWNKEAALSGNVNWSFAYVLLYPFASPNVDAAAVTTVSLGSIAVAGAQYAFQYELPAAISAINIADGAFGSKPFIQCSLVRDGVADSYNGAVAVSIATMTRII